MPWDAWPKASKQIIVKWPNSYIALWCSRIRIPLGLKKMWTTTLQCQPFKFWIITISSKKNTSCIVFTLSNRFSLSFLISVPMFQLPSSHGMLFFLFILQTMFSLQTSLHINLYVSSCPLKSDWSLSIHVHTAIPFCTTHLTFNTSWIMSSFALWIFLSWLDYTLGRCLKILYIFLYVLDACFTWSRAQLMF